MGFFNWLFYIVCGFFLFIFICLLKNKFKINNFQSIVFSILFMFIISGICSKYGFAKLNINIFLIFVFEMVFKIIYYSYFLEEDFFDKSENNIIYYIILIFLGYLFNVSFINKVSYVFLSSDDIKIISWFMIIMFLYQFLKDNNFLNKVESNGKRSIKDKNVFVSYAKLKSVYHDVVNYDNKIINDIIYSIMVYENYKRPKFLRNVDNFRYRFDGHASKMGIMQVNSKKFISDVESIEIVYKKISKLYEKNTSKNKIDVNKIITSYNKEDSEEILNIYDKISKF